MKRMLAIAFGVGLLFAPLAQAAGTSTAPKTVAGVSRSAEHPQVELKTNVGDIVVELYPEKAPKTVANFLDYVNNGFYNGTIFHRSVKNFIVQGGGYTVDLKPKATKDPIPNEADNGLVNAPGTIAMARAGDPQSATSQFFINLDDNKFLNHYRKDKDYYGYAVFGRVVSGMDVVKKIAAIPTGSKGGFTEDFPVKEVVIESVSVTGPNSAAFRTAQRKGNDG